MKKYLFLISVAAIALTACTNEKEEFVGSPQSREIAFKAIAQPNTRAAIQSGVFPTTNTMEIAAYQSAPATASNYFTKMTFAKDGDVWTGGESPKYWPLSEATLNFFAISGAGLTASHVTINADLATASIAYTSANSYNKETQSDIMYAFNRGSVTKSGNTLSFNGGNAVGMTFLHALALVNFQIKAADDASTAISIKKIELNGACYTGTLNITNTNAEKVDGAWSTQLDWNPDDVVNNVKVPNIGNETTPVALTTSYVPANTTTASDEGNPWAALMVIPKQQKGDSPESYGFTTFKIHYKFNNKDYTYEYAPGGYSGSTPNLTVVEAGKKYTYQISMQLHEITVTPSVTQWDDSANNVGI